MGLRYLTILGSPFTPRSVTGLRVWLDASDASTINSGTPVDGDHISTWTDKSTNAYSFAQGTDALRPIYKTNIQNSLSIARGSSSLIGANIGTDLTAMSVFFVINFTTLRQFDAIISSNTQATGQMNIEIGAGPSQLDVYDTNVGAKMATGTSTVATSTWYVCEVEYDQATPLGTFYIGNVSKNTTNQASMYLEATNLNIFDDGAGGFTNLRADIGEIVIYSNVVSSANRTLVYNYLKTKWNTP